MRPLRARDVPAGAAITIVALVLAASVVKGREETRAPAPSAPAPAAAAAPVELDLEQLKRLRKEGDPPDLFAPRLSPPPVAVAAAKPAPPPAPSAPPLPFKYLGRMVDGGRTVVFLEHNQESIAAAAGEPLGGSYLLESIGESSLQFVYLPLGAKQALAIPALP